MARVTPHNETPKFEILEHPADVGFFAYGATLEELFANAALAMISIGGDAERVREQERREIDVRGEDAEQLLYAWLAEILAVTDAERLAVRRAEVTELVTRPGEGRVCGVVFGEAYDRARHQSGVSIKAVTYHQFAIDRTEAGWRARVYLDL
ncbi:MAG TPA: archease [Candidatus Acidoferrales bacterium]|jgi:SHS2 domain-containing protein|nr:archease [Candidatus Acidoferrales bacterium]